MCDNSVVFPAFLVPAFFIGFGYRELAIGYLNTGRDLRRMESNTRSPIFSDFGELLEGIVTVRAFSAEKRFLNNLHVKIDTTTKMWYTFWMTNRWLLLLDRSDSAEFVHGCEDVFPKFRFVFQLSKGYPLI